ncbi:hypothetical protein PIB30_074844 [Stylosanthes scabra]|uniref:Uncharacterized protein n=1 Tax=Stylosanthes scabra TaxID=79078 RepID=A0ABU6QPC7_9FABA|nr:hypothetical protein [Stylosanthes scabra]
MVGGSDMGRGDSYGEVSLALEAETPHEVGGNDGCFKGADEGGINEFRGGDGGGVSLQGVTGTAGAVGERFGITVENVIAWRTTDRKNALEADSGDPRSQLMSTFGDGNLGFLVRICGGTFQRQQQPHGLRDVEEAQAKSTPLSSTVIVVFSFIFFSRQCLSLTLSFVSSSVPLSPLPPLHDSDVTMGGDGERSEKRQNNEGLWEEGVL